MKVKETLQLAVIMVGGPNLEYLHRHLGSRVAIAIALPSATVSTYTNGHN
jgi:hypothetical protein